MARILWSSLAKDARSILIPFKKIKEGYYTYTIVQTLTPYIRLTINEIRSGERISTKNILLRIKHRNLLPEELGYALNLLSLVQLPRLARYLPPTSPPIAMIYFLSSNKLELVASTLTYIEASKEHLLTNPIEPFLIIVVGSSKAVDPNKVKGLIEKRVKTDIDATLQHALPVIEKSLQFTPRKQRHLVGTGIPVKIFLVVAPSFTTKEISIEFSDGIEVHRITIPLRRSNWRLSDFPEKIASEIKTILVNPYKSNKPYAPRGAIIVGPPGVGKTSLAEAIADAMNTKIVKLTPSTYRSMWYGATERILTSIFDKLRDRKDVTILIDDAEFMTGRHYAIHEVSIAEISILLNTLQDPRRPFTILTSNAPELIDPALLRPGRIDAIILLGYPDRDSRRKAVEVLVKRYGIKANREIIEDIVVKTKWFTHAELDALIRLAASMGNGVLTPDSIEWAYRKFNINDSERRRIQDYMRWYVEKLQGMIISFIAGETDI